MAQPLSTPLLSDAHVVKHVPPIVSASMLLSVCLLCSGIGMVSLKGSQVWARRDLLVLGYTLEAIAFGIYPLCLDVLPLRVVTVLWAASSNIVALVSGVVLFGDAVSHQAAFGCMLTVLGVFLVAFAG